MSHGFMIIAILVLAGISISLAFFTASKVTDNLENKGEWKAALLRAVILMDLILLVNATGFVSVAEIDSIDQNRWHILENQFWLLIGTASLMALGEAAIRDPWVLDTSKPKITTARVFVRIMEKLLFRFWWAALGLGLIFGFRARGIALLLATELTASWIAARLILFKQESKE